MKNFNSPTHQLTNSPTHQLTNSPTHQLRSKLFLFLVGLLMTTHFSLAQQSFDDCVYEEELIINNGINNTSNCSGTTNCGCPEYFSGSIDQNLLDTYSNICYDVQIWVSNDDFGNNQFPYTQQELNETILQLNNDFAIANLSFNLVNITEINESDYQYLPNRFDYPDIFIDNLYHNPTALNIYIVNANFWGQRSGLNIVVNMDPFLNYRALVTHEVGHIFGLAHTQGGGGYTPEQWYVGGSPNDCEHVTRNTNDPDYNALCAGDNVTDTNAVPNFRDEKIYEEAQALINNGTFSNYYLAFNHVKDNRETYNIDGYDYVDFNTLPYTYTGTIENCAGESFTLIDSADLTNFMAYTDRSKPGNFTNGQAIRMREYIEYFNNESSTFNYLDVVTSVNTYDLMIANSEEDYGQEPDFKTQVVTNSTDIWVRNQPDGLINQEHEDLHYVNDQTPVYVYVKVTNRSCETTTGNDDLELYWAKGGLFQQWDNVWKGLAPVNGMQTGGEIATQNIPILSSGETAILEFPWFPGNPNDYDYPGMAKPWMFCFLARIDSLDDPMTSVETQYPNNNAQLNNNIAYKNTTVINVNQNPRIGSILAGNLGNANSLISDIRFFTLGNANANLWNEAEVHVQLDEVLWDKWIASGSESRGVKIVDENKHIILVEQNDARLESIAFAPNETGMLTIGVEFLVNKVGAQENFELQVEQIHTKEQFGLGGFTYVFIRDNGRGDFDAVGERERLNNTITLKANNINEPATYNWYNEEGDLVYSGEQLTVTDPLAQTYKLEIIADSDGHKDYGTVNSESPFTLESISPNPASNQIQVCYQTAGANSSYLSITSTQTAVSNNYILNNTLADLTIDVSSYSTGTYVVALICDGQVIETKNLVIQ